MAITSITPTGSALAFLDKRSADSAWFRYRAPSGFTAGVLVIEDDAGARRTVSLTAGGTVEVSGFSTGGYRIYAIGWNAAAETASVSNAVTYFHYDSEPDTPFDVEYRTDYMDAWRGGRCDDGTIRERLMPDATGHWLQWRLRHNRQNQRIVLRSLQMEVRLHGKAYSASEA